MNGDNGDEDIDIDNATTIVDLFGRHGITYKIYQEDYPTSGQCFLGSYHGTKRRQGLYRRKHNPFISFKSYTNSQWHCSSQRDFHDLHYNIETGSLPRFSYVVPNQVHDGHSSSVKRAGHWYAKFVGELLQSRLFATSRVLVHTVFDEDESAYIYYYNYDVNDLGEPNPYFNASCMYTYYSPPNACAPAGCTDVLNCTLDKTNNNVYSILFGSAVPQSLVNTTDDTYYTHSSIVATLEANWDLGSLGREDLTSNVFNISI